MASLALTRGAGEFKRSVALLALHKRMLPLQSKARFFMLELHIHPQRGPALGCMAIAARNFDFAMRVVYGGDLPFRPTNQQRATNDHHPA